jgi:agmatinase
MREEIIDPNTSVQIGIRTHNSDTYGFTVLGAPWVHREGIPAVIDVIREVVGKRQSYLTFDIDCLDPAFAPGTGTPVSGGLSTAQALEAIRSLGEFEIVGMDVVEVAPAYDISEITAIAAATLLHDFICLQAVKAGAVPQPFGYT